MAEAVLAGFDVARREVDFVAAVFFFAMGALSPLRTRPERACRLAADENVFGVTGYVGTDYREKIASPRQLLPVSKTKADVVQTPISSVKEPQVPVTYEDAEFCRIRTYLTGSSESVLDGSCLQFASGTKEPE